MRKTLHSDMAAEKEANDIGARFMHSSDVVGDMSRAYGRDLSSVRIHTDDSAAQGAAERGVDAFSTGKDIFFARGAFDQSAPANRGLLAHELSHSLQQGVGGGAPALSQSAPMGAAQGGLRDLFRSMFGRSGSAEQTAQETASAGQDTEDMAAPPAFAQGADPRETLDNAVTALRKSKKWGLGQNSEEFERVSDAIDLSIRHLSTPLSGNIAQDEEVLNGIIAVFGTLIQSCDNYLRSHAPSTDRGKHRKAIISQIKALAVNDQYGFIRYMKTPDEGEHFTNAMDILAKSRQRTLQLVKGGEKDLPHVGNAASYIAKIDPGMLTDAGASGFFKADEVFERYSTLDSTKLRLDSLEAVKKQMNLTEAQYNAIKDAILSPKRGTLPVGYYQDRTIHEAMNLVDRLISVNTTVNNNLNIGEHFRVGDTLNLSKRNVATSRLAKLLGVEDLIATSETATLADADGTQRSGNLMQTAKGQEVTSFIVEQFRDQFAAVRKDYERDDQVTLEGNLDDKVSPAFLKSLTSLQVLDNLAGQVDRHTANFFAEVIDGKLGKVQGIDNDFSFTDATLDWSGKRNNRIGTHGKSILGRDQSLILPYMDKALADRITALDATHLKAVMADVLEPWAIDALVTRFEQVKTAIEQDQSKERYLERDEDWERPEVFATLRNSTEHFKGSLGPQATNYVSNVLLGADMSIPGVDSPSSMIINGVLNNDLFMRLAEEVLTKAKDMKDVEKAKAYLSGYGVQEDVLSYLETTEQLLDGPVLLKRLPNSELFDPIYNTINAEWRQEREKKQAEK